MVYFLFWDLCVSLLDACMCVILFVGFVFSFVGLGMICRFDVCLAVDLCV